MDPHPVDIHVGKRLRLARAFRQLSQSSLGRSVGVTFQQVQKYETGANRVSASRLVEFATVLEIDVAFFFQDLPRTAQPSHAPQPSAVDTEIVIELACLRDVQLKRVLLAFIRQLARKWAKVQQPTPPLADPEGNTIEVDISR
jgi:transcriptional regulator with XRE-family HTH domain